MSIQRIPVKYASKKEEYIDHFDTNFHHIFGNVRGKRGGMTKKGLKFHNDIFETNITFEGLEKMRSILDSKDIKRMKKFEAANPDYFNAGDEPWMVEVEVN